MSKIAYDPVKDRFAQIIRNNRWLRTLFYRILDLFFLRSWYVRSVLRRYAGPIDDKRNWKLLDAGGGFGQYDRFLLHQFGRVTIDSIDIKDDYLHDCRIYFEESIREGRIHFANQDLLALEDEAEFDFVICVDVLEHIEQDRQAIGNLAKSLKEGGYFLMHSPSHYSEEDAGEEETFVDEHARAGYSREDISEKVSEAGLDPVEVEYTYGPPGHAAWVMLIKYPMLWMNKISLFALPFIAIWYLLTLPVGLILMKMDLAQTNEKGTGIYALARKKQL